MHQNYAKLCVIAYFDTNAGEQRGRGYRRACDRREL